MAIVMAVYVKPENPKPENSVWVPLSRWQSEVMDKWDSATQTYTRRPCDDTRDGFYLQTTHVGLVLSTYERNGRDDSDFYAIVWNPLTQKPEHIEYASTRGWTYANGATVDATPEVLEAYAAWRKAADDAARAAAAEREANNPTRGKKVRIIAGRGPKGFNGVWIGSTGEIFWRGVNQFGTYYRNGYNRPEAAHNQRLGIMLDNGVKVFTALTNVAVVR